MTISPQTPSPVISREKQTKYSHNHSKAGFERPPLFFQITRM